MHRLPFESGQRQQCHHGAVVIAGNKFRQLCRLQRLGGIGQKRRSGEGHRMGRAAGGDWQLSPKICLPGLVRRSSKARAGIARIAQPHHRWCGAVPDAARRIPVCRRRCGGLPCVRRGQYREQGRFTTHYFGTILAAWPGCPHPQQERDLYGSANQPVDRPGQKQG